MARKIAILTPLYYPSPGGVQAVMRCMARYAASEGAVVKIFTTQSHDLDEVQESLAHVRHYADEESFEGTQIRRFETGGLTQRLLRFFYAVAFHLRLPFWNKIYHLHGLHSIRADQMSRAVKAFAPDVLLVSPFSSYMLETAIALKRTCGAALIAKTSVHPEDADPSFSSLPLLNEADWIWVNTFYEKSFLERNGVDSKKIRVLGPAFDLNSYLEEDQASKSVLEARLKNERFVLYLGRMQKGKGVPELVLAMREVRRAHPDTRLVLAGDTTEYFRRHIEPLIRNDANVIFAGETDESGKHWLLENAAVYSMVSNIDSFGIVYLEAWLHGKPVVGADLEAIREVIRDGEDGLLVPYGEPKKLAEALSKLLDDPNLCSRLGAAGRAKVMERFSDQKVEKAVFRLLRLS